MDAIANILEFFFQDNEIFDIYTMQFHFVRSGADKSVASLLRSCRGHYSSSDPATSQH